MKIVGAILVGGFALAFGLAFAIEMFLSQTLKRPVEFERKVGMPVFMYLPRIRRKPLKKRPALPPAPHHPRLGDGTAAPEPSPGKDALSSVVAGPPPDLSGLDGLSAYYEALRDRLITYFDVRNMTHKPKLVAVTGCSKGAGVSSVATGLASMLSETGDGNVLLVDMSSGNGAAHPFYRGKPGSSLADAIQDGGREDSQVQDRLFVATLPSQDGRLPRILPKAFGHLVPRMKASDYDFIVFDMPPLSQTSPTARLASHMDMTLLVIEAEKDHVDVIRQAAASLREAKANVGALFNKKRSYVPSWLTPEA
jgi:Mrp family chromosome partitioning ATPase